MRNSVRAGVSILVSSLGFALAGCGGRGSVGPTAATAASQTLRVVDGLSRSAVPALAVSVDSQPYVTDGAGTLTADVRSGAVISTSGTASYIDRKTTYSGDNDLALWPVQGPWNAPYYRTVVYDRSWAKGVGPLLRPEPGVYTVSASADIRADPDALWMLQAALAEVGRVTHGAITFRWVGKDGDVTYEISQTDRLIGSNWGVSSLRTSGNTITGARIIIRTLDIARLNVALHETGHFLGLCHSPDPGDVMCVTSGRSYVSTRLGAGEESALLMMAQRRPGNRFPDSDPAVSGASVSPGATVVRCGG